MERLYALGVACIEFIQEWLADSESYFALINELSNPNYVLEVLFPLVSIVDSVFAAQLCLCMAFGGWINAVMKWWFLEDRPYWWIRETDFYADTRRPVLRQTRQTCETGPGSPSGHSETAAMVLLLIICWTAHIINDRKWHVWWWKYVMFPLCGVAMLSVMLARLFVAAHFPHQVLFGALLGAFLAPALCIYVCDPYIWRCGYYVTADVDRVRLMHGVSAILTIAIALVTYLGLRVCGWDPLWTVKLAFRWCEHPDTISVSTTPMFAFAHFTGHLIGWAACVTPAVAEYRHYTKNRSLVISTVLTGTIVYLWQFLTSQISKDVAWKFYVLHFILCIFKPAMLLRVAPSIAMWPFTEDVSSKIKQN